MDRAEKREFVAELNGVFTNAGSVVVAHYAGLTVAQMNDLRSRMRTAGGTVKVAKNRLAKIALQGTESDAGNTHRPDRQRTWRCGGARHWRLRPEGRSRIRRNFAVN